MTLPFRVLVSEQVPPGEVWFAEPVEARLEAEGATVRLVETFRVKGRIVDVGPSA